MDRSSAGVAPRNLFLVLGPEVLKHSINVREDKKRIGLQGLGHDRTP